MFDHEKVNQQTLNAAAETFVPILKEHGIKVLIGDCDVKLHNKGLADMLWEHGIFLWPGGGKSCGAHKCGYPLVRMIVIRVSFGFLSGRMMHQN